MIHSKGYAAQSAETDLAPWSFERQDVGPQDVLIDIAYCGVCHTDVHLTRNEWFPGLFPMVPGHEIVGIVRQIGSHVTKFKTGDRAAVGVMVDSCLDCEDCKNGQEQFCQVSPVLTYNNLDHRDQPAYGGYANNIVVSEHFVLHVAENLDFASVAPLLCAGITTYSPLRRWQVGKGHKLAVVGLGGLGHMAVKFGVAFGAEVTVLSTSPNKEAAARTLGAHHFVVTKDDEQMKESLRSFNFIIDTVAANHDINPYVALLKTNGVYINVGMPAEPWQVSSFSLATGNKVITGSGAGGLPETQEMLDFCAEHNIVSDVELIDIKDIHTAFERMLKGDVRGNYEGFTLMIHPDFLRPYPLGKTIKNYGFFSYSSTEALHLSEKERETIMGVFRSIGEELALPIDQFSQDVIVTQIELLLNYSNRFYNRQFITRKAANHDILTKLETLLANYFDSQKTLTEGLPTVQYISDQLAVSPRYLSDMLRSLTGQSAQQHIHTRLIEKAKEILSTSNLTTAEVAYQLGFEHPQSFNKIFKRKTNVSPIEFRQTFN